MDIEHDVGCWPYLKMIWRDFICWIAWHKHVTPSGGWCTYCLRCGEHSKEHSL